MKTFPSLYATWKNVKAGARPVWILKLTAGGVDYYISDSAFPIAFWGVTTKGWAKTWGEVREGISGALDEFKISDTSVVCVADPADAPNIVDLALQYDLEKDPVSLYQWYVKETDRIPDSLTLANHVIQKIGTPSVQKQVIVNGVAELSVTAKLNPSMDLRLLSCPVGVNGLTFTKEVDLLYTFEWQWLLGYFEVRLCGPVVDDNANANLLVATLRPEAAGSILPSAGVTVEQNVLLPDGFRRVTLRFPKTVFTGSGRTGYLYVGLPAIGGGQYHYFYRKPSMQQPGSGCGDPPQEFFRGYLRDYPISEGRTLCTLQMQDESLKWERTYIGEKITREKYPHADPDDVGKIEPIIFGSVEKFPALAVNAGTQTTLTNAVTTTATSINVADGDAVTVGMVLQVDSEQMTVQAVNGDTLTVSRGSNGTLAATHQRAAVAWEQKGSFVYIVAGHPVASIPKAYAVVGGYYLDISLLCTAWPAGDHPDYPGRAVIVVPGYITIEQAVSLAVADGIIVSNGTLSPALSGNVTKTGNAVLAGNVGISGQPTLLGDPDRTGSVTLTGLINLLGSILDPGHTHETGDSSDENTTISLPTNTNWAGAASGNVSWGGYNHPWTFWALPFTADGARSDATYTIEVTITVTPGYSQYVTLYAAVNSGGYLGVYKYDFGLKSGTFTFKFTYSAGSQSYNTLYVGLESPVNQYLQVTSASRTIKLTGLVSGANSASVSNGSLTADRGTLATADTLMPARGTLSTNRNTLTATNSTLNVADGIIIDKGTLLALLSGNVAKTGTVALSGNSVANTLVGDKLLVNVSRNLSAPGDVIASLLSTWCGVASFRQIGAFPAGYAFNGALTDYRLAMDVIHDLAWQCRSWFRHSLGSGVLIVRSLVPVSAKVASCKVQGGKKVHSQAKSEYGEIINTINLLYGRDWTVDKSDKAYASVSSDADQDSVDVFGVQERPGDFQFDFVTTQAMADDLRSFYLAYYAVRHWRHTFDTYYYDSELEFADGVTLGFAGNVVGQVEEVGFDPGGDTVQMKVIQ